MRTGDKVICTGVHQSWRGKLKPLPKPGWVYVVENLEVVKIKNGTRTAVVKLLGVESANGMLPEACDFIEVGAARDFQAIRTKTKK